MKALRSMFDLTKLIFMPICVHGRDPWANKINQIVHQLINLVQIRVVLILIPTIHV